MATTYPLPTLACSISVAGITSPSYDDILASLKASFKIIYGDDAYLEPDSQDGQWLAILAQGFHDCNQATIAAYNSYSPQTAVGVGLSNAVKLNHMERLVPTKSQVNLTLIGVAGTTIINGIVADGEGNRWMLPALVNIPSEGTITVTATAEKAGAITAPINTVVRIQTPTAGWQSATNPNPATPGLPVETDAQLRARQELTPALNAVTVLEGIVAAIKALPGVIYGTCYHNDGDAVDANGLPGHSIALVVKGGDSAAIGSTLARKKSPGVATYGTTTVTVVDSTGTPESINYFVPTEKPCKVAISVTVESNYTTAIAQQIKDSVAAFINGLSIAEDLVVNRLYSAALLYGAAESETYKITSLQAGLVSGAVGSSDVVISFIEKATCLASDVTITVV